MDLYYAHLFDFLPDRSCNCDQVLLPGHSQGQGI
jgi:hypothetical protein